MLKTWRELLVGNVTVHKNSICVSFVDSIVSLQVNKKYLRQQSINWKHIVKGRIILIKGKSGNEDVLLARPDALEGIVLIPEKK